jgi:hypothetical protein
MSFNKIQKKGELIINPTTQRPIRVGSRVWLKCVKDGIIEGNHTDPNELYNMREGDNINDKINEINQTLPANLQAVKGRGKYKDKIVKRNKQPSTQEISQYTAKIASKAVSNPKVYKKLKEADDFELQLENMIMTEMMGSVPNMKKNNPIRKLTNKKETSYQLKNETEEDDEDDEEVDDNDYEY